MRPQVATPPCSGDYRDILATFLEVMLLITLQMWQSRFAYEVTSEMK